MNGSGVGAILGLLGALGLLLVIGRLPYRRRLLAPRVEGYLGNPTSMPSSAGAGSRTTASAFLTRAVASGAGWLDQLVGGHGSVRRRLDQLGAGSTEEFRIA